METGHVKQVATFEKFVEFCNAHGTLFNPSKAAVQLTALNTLLKSAQQAIEQVKIAQTEAEIATNARKDAFEQLPKFMTRVINALAASEAPASAMEDAYTIIYKVRPGKSKVKASAKLITEPEPELLGRKTSHQDFDSKASNFESLIKLVSQVPTYQPNEPDLQLSSLREKVTQLHGYNSRVIETQVSLSNARVHRNKLLYGPGIHRATRMVKHYMKAAFGYQSAAYRQISGLEFLKKRDG